MNFKFEISNFKSGFSIGGLLVKSWWYLRQITGDAAYENYLHRSQCSHGSCRILSREEFYLDVLRRRYTGVSRCC